MGSTGLRKPVLSLTQPGPPPAMRTPRGVCGRGGLPGGHLAACTPPLVGAPAAPAGPSPPAHLSRPGLGAPADDDRCNNDTGDCRHRPRHITHSWCPGSGHVEGNEETRERGPPDNGAALGRQVFSGTGCMSHRLDNGQSSHRPRCPGRLRCHDSGRCGGDGEGHAPSHLPFQG